MKRNLTANQIKEYLEKMIESRIPTQAQAHEEFNKGVKFVTDYVFEYIDVEIKPTWWRKFLMRFF